MADSWDITALNMKKSPVKPLSHHTYKIMLVESNRQNRKKTVELMTTLGYQVYTANDGFDALSKSIDYQPDLIFIYTELSEDLDGYQTSKLIKSNHAFSNTPIVLITNKATDFNPHKTETSGAITQINKPLDKDKLLAQISIHLS